MTAASELLVRPVPRPAGRPFGVRLPFVWLTAFAVANALVFLIVQPPVGDLWAARARQSAATHGVGLGYWFSWFSGGSTPGNYSVLSPYLSGVFGSAVLGALATVALTPLTAHLLRGSTHRTAATTVCTFVVGTSLWSARVPFALGTVFVLAALIEVRRRRRAGGAAWAVVSALVSPVSAAFLVMGAGALFLVQPRFRTVSAWTAGAGLASLLTIAIVFGAPGPEPFPAHRALLLVAALGLMLAARPAGYVRVVIVVATAACLPLAMIPNGMGSNFQRLVWIYLPVAVVATATVRMRSALAACLLSIALGVEATAGDLWVSAQPMSSGRYYDSLAAQLDRTSGLADFRVEVVSDGTHTAAYALLEHAMLARGYETQEDNAYNAILMSTTLDAVSYKVWLDNNAVGFVAIARKSLSTNPEEQLVARHRPYYLKEIWSDQHWLLYRVVNPSPIITPPAAVIDADQASLQIKVPRAGRYTVRVHWSSFLKVSTKPNVTAMLSDDGFGFTNMTVSAPGIYTMHG
ncbi:MAG: hypothetical protein ACRDVG_02080 [Jatrophihabitantaceae bacterium]